MNRLMHVLWTVSVWEVQGKDRLYCFTMNSSVKQNIISSTFLGISRDVSLCMPCFDNEIQSHVSTEQDILIHIYFKHRGFWNASIYLPESISSHVWLKLFESLDQSIVKCRHCGMIFVNSTPRMLHEHTKTRHPIILLGFSISKH